MKSREAFVSNSSSTSFCIIGVDKDSYGNPDVSREKRGILDILAELEEIDVDDEYSFGYGQENGKHLSFYGSEGEVYYVGLSADDLLQTMTIPEAKKYFVDSVARWFGLEIPVEYIEFIYGESGSG